MKVLHLISGGDTGGAKTHIINLCSQLKNMITLKVICFIKGPFYYDVKKENIDIEVYEQKNRFDLSIIKRLLALIISEKYEIVHCHGARANFIGMFLKRYVKDVPFITTVHSDFDLDFKDVFYKNIIFSKLNKLALKKFDYFVSVGSPLIDKLVSLGIKKEKIFLLYNGFDYTKNISFEDKNAFLSKKLNDVDWNNKFIIGNLSRLYKVKGLDIFIKAADIVMQKYKNVLFLIGGEGPQRNFLQNLIYQYGLEKHVYLLGEISNPYDFFNAIDINVISSYSETFPYSILESTVLEKCCISSAVGSIPDLIENNENGLLFTPSDYNHLANCILYLLENAHLIPQFGNRLTKKAKNLFSSQAMAEKQIEIYSKIKKSANI